MTALHDLAAAHRVSTHYLDMNHQRQEASDDGLVAVLRALGAPIERPADAADVLRERRRGEWGRLVEPVTLARPGAAPHIVLRVPNGVPDEKIVYTILLEDGGKRAGTARTQSLPGHAPAQVDGVPYAQLGIVLPEVPLGVHVVRLKRLEVTAETHLICAPVQAYSGEHRSWGVFSPVYALRHGGAMGMGDFSGLSRTLDWVADHGGRYVAILPILAQFLDQPFEPSPYSPASRLFWNEVYVDLAALPEMRRSPRREELTRDLKGALAPLDAAELVDWRAQAVARSRVMAILAEELSTQDGPRREAFEKYVAGHERLRDYAAFRAAGRRHDGKPWWEWPAAARDGQLGPDDDDTATRRYHLYAQWVTAEQLGHIGRRATERGGALYLDLPVGVGSASYDVWRHRRAFALGMTAGAPPDPFFTGGQNWGFPPLHPERIREDGHAYFRAVLRHHLESAGILRIDHVMHLFRLFWIPEGAHAKEGVYVHYPVEELWAILCLESQRAKAQLVGEDLGTVPDGVRETMGMHRMQRTYVAQFEVSPEPSRALGPTPQLATASVNTHDMPPFAAFWRALDVEDRVDLGHLTPEQAVHERASRGRIRESVTRFLWERGLLGSDATDEDVLRAVVRHLAASEADALVVNLEDLWGETRPQNVPGTSEERPNWRRRATRSLEQVVADPALSKFLDEVTAARART